MLLQLPDIPDLSKCYALASESGASGAKASYCLHLEEEQA